LIRKKIVTEEQDADYVTTRREKIQKLLRLEGLGTICRKKWKKI